MKLFARPNDFVEEFPYEVVVFVEVVGSSFQRSCGNSSRAKWQRVSPEEHRTPARNGAAKSCGFSFEWFAASQSGRELSFEILN